VDARHVGLLGLGEGSRTAALVACLDGCAALALLGGCEAWLAALQADEGPLDGWSLPGLLEVSDWPDLVIAAWTAGLYVETDDAELARLLAEARDVLGHSEAARVAEPGAEGLKTFLDEWLVIPSRAS
jgi:hypothetical protein